MDTLDDIKHAAHLVDTKFLASVNVGDHIDVEDFVFVVSSIKPIKQSRFAVDLNCDGYVFTYHPIYMPDYERKYITADDWSHPKKKRKRKNAARDEEIYQKSFTESSKDLAVEYNVSYAMIRYIIRKMAKEDFENNG